MTQDRDKLMTSFQAAIWKFLREGYVGPENSAKRAAIEARFFLLHESMRHGSIEGDDRKFREAVSDLVTVFKKPICSTPAGGYFVGRTMQEIQRAAYGLIAQGNNTAQRGRALLETIPLERQGNLF